jgi:hypothetical protein
MTNREAHARYNAKYPGKAKAALHATQVRNLAINKKYADDYREQHPCTICGEARVDCLVFHHVGEKDYEVCKTFRHSPKICQDEIAKCIVLCANCHSVLHAAERKGIGWAEWKKIQPGSNIPLISNQLSLFDSSTSAY